MFCSKCGIELPVNAIICYQCATPTKKGELLQNSAQNNNQNTTNDLLKFLAMAFIVAVGVGVAVIAANNFSAIKNSLSNPPNEVSVSRTTTYNTPVTPVIEPPKTQPKTKINSPLPQAIESIQIPQKETIIDKTFFVNARSFESFSFKLNRDARLLQVNFQLRAERMILIA